MAPPSGPWVVQTSNPAETVPGQPALNSSRSPMNNTSKRMIADRMDILPSFLAIDCPIPIAGPATQSDRQFRFQL
jgi:hypothetical protein